MAEEVETMHPFSAATSLLVALSVAPAQLAPPAISLDVGLARSMLPAGQRTTAHLRVSLIGQALPPANARAPVNVCLAIDRSGSMQGEKIARAREGAIAALRRLDGGDLVSVVAYDDVVQVLVPATAAGNRAGIAAGIRTLQPGGSTALFAGVVKCAAEVRKHLDRDRVNRIVLLSDGMANVGPSSPAELGALGSQLMEEGISVSTVGLGTGYNEDLMTELALRSDGGHAFVEHPADLARFLDEELAAATEVVAREVEVRIRCAAGVRPVRVLGRRADIVGDTVTVPFAKIYARRQHYFVVELEVDPGLAGSKRRLGEVEASFYDLISRHLSRRTGTILAGFTPRAAEVEASTDRRIMAELGMIEDNANTARAAELLNQGDVQAAEQVLQQNAAQLAETARQTQDGRLRARVQRARQQAETVNKTPIDKQLKQWRKQVSDDPLEGLKL
jgi:Ca-activated chloride channel family protein